MKLTALANVRTFQELMNKKTNIGEFRGKLMRIELNVLSALHICICINIGNITT